MTGLDWLILAIIALSMLVAAAQGFFFEIFSLAGAVLGFLLAAWEYPRVAPRFLPYAREPWVADLAAFLAIFFITLLLAGVAGRVARWLLKGAGLQWFDRLLGAAFGLLRGGIVVTVLVLGIAAFSPQARTLSESLLARYFLVLGRGVAVAAPSQVREKFRQGVIAARDFVPGPAEPQPPQDDGPQP